MEYRKTCKRYNTPGDAHVFTFSCFGRKPFLSKARSCKWFCEAVESSREKYEFYVWAYVVMPEHVHLLICPKNREYSVSDILKAIKQSVSKKAVRFVRKHAPEFLPQIEDRQPNGKVYYRFWQRGGGYDRNLDNSRTVTKEIDYIHWNPVRRGLCENPEDWYYSSAADFAMLRTGPIRIDFDSIPDRED